MPPNGQQQPFTSCSRGAGGLGKRIKKWELLIKIM
jgi:hypothetical protein